MNESFVTRACRSDRERPLRIAIVHASDMGGGAERSVLSLHKGLRELGHHSTMFVGERRTDEDGVVQIPYVRGMPGSRRAARWLERGLGLQDIYNPSFRSLRASFANNFDVVHFNSLWGSAGFGDIGALPALTRLVPGVITMRENWLITGHCACFEDCFRWRTGCGSCPDLQRVPKLERDGTAMNWLRKRSAIQNSRLQVVAISDWLAEQARQSPILAGKPISRIYNGIDLQTFSPLDPEDRKRRREALGIAEEDVVVLLAGQTVNGLNSFQPPIDAAEALNANSDDPRIRPLVIGDGAGRMASRLRAAPICLPYQKEPAGMAACFGLADITLVTSQAEAFGRIAAESQACGAPVVAFDTGGIPEVVCEGVGGLVFRRGDTERLAAGLRRLSDDKELRRRMTADGKTYVERHFDQTNISAQYLAVYRQTIEKHAARKSRADRAFVPAKAAAQVRLQQPKVAVVIPAFNAEEYLERAVDSVFSTNYENVEVVIVDDGSKDGTLAAARRACAKFPGSCRLLRHQQGLNRGVSASRNLGVNASSSEWVVFLDADDYFLPHRFESLLRISDDSTNTVDAIYELAEVIAEGSGTGSGSGGPGVFGIAEELTGAPLLERLLSGQCWQVGAVTVRRDLLATTGLFDPGKRIAEDCDFWYRLAAAGNVVAGDLYRPVSVYWRHARNTYRYELRHRVDVLRAMLDSWTWARKTDISPECLGLFGGAANRYATRTVIAAREASQPRIAGRVLLQMAAAGNFRYVFGYEGLRQSWAVVRELAKRKSSSSAQ